MAGLRDHRGFRIGQVAAQALQHLRVVVPGCAPGAEQHDAQAVVAGERGQIVREHGEGGVVAELRRELHRHVALREPRPQRRGFAPRGVACHLGAEQARDQHRRIGDERSVDACRGERVPGVPVAHLHLCRRAQLGERFGTQRGGQGRKADAADAGVHDARPGWQRGVRDEVGQSARACQRLPRPGFARGRVAVVQRDRRGCGGRRRRTG